MRLALLGDSIAWGQGAAREQHRPAGRLTKALAEQRIAATTEVFAVPGARSAGLAAQVDRAVLWSPDVSVLIIGANDLTHLVPTEDAVADLGAAVRRLRTAGSEVVVAPAPDLSSIPAIPALLRPAVQAASAELRRRQASAVVAAGGRVADGDAATARAFADDPRLFSADRFHPSSVGYAVIASMLVPEVLAAAAAAEREAH